MAPQYVYINNIILINIPRYRALRCSRNVQIYQNNIYEYTYNRLGNKQF